MLENGEEEPLLLLNASMVRTNSVKSRATIGLNQSKSQDITALARKYESEIKELREQNEDLEMKNRKYLEIIGLTATEQHEDLKLKMEAAQKSLSFAKRTKRLAAS